MTAGSASNICWWRPEPSETVALMQAEDVREFAPLDLGTLGQIKRDDFDAQAALGIAANVLSEFHL